MEGRSDGSGSAVRAHLGWMLLALAPLCSPVSVAAQTDDAVFGGWRSNPLTVGSRPAGLGGAFVALADDGRAAVVNPAGLTQIPLTEITLSSGRPWFSIGRGQGRLHLAAYYTKAEQEQASFLNEESRLALQASIWEAGAAAAVQALGRVRVGVAVAYQHLRIEEEGRGPENGSQPVSSLVGREDGQVRTTIGAMVDLIPARVAGSSPLKLGLTFQPGVSFMVPRPANPDVEIRRPRVTSLGLAFRASNAWSLTGQLDFIRYDEVVDALRRNVGETAGRDFVLSNAAEPRLGAEYATPLRCGCGTVKIRAGLHYESPGTLEFQGGDPLLREAFRVRSWRTTVSLGASLFAEHFGNALRFDVDSRDVMDGPALSAGVVWRF